MTAREFIQQILLTTLSLDAEVYIQTTNEEDIHDYVIDNITNGRTNDAVFIEIKDWV